MPNSGNETRTREAFDAAVWIEHADRAGMRPTVMIADEAVYLCCNQHRLCGERPPALRDDESLGAVIDALQATGRVTKGWVKNYG